MPMILQTILQILNGLAYYLGWGVIVFVIVAAWAWFVASRRLGKGKVIEAWKNSWKRARRFERSGWREE